MNGKEDLLISGEPEVPAGDSYVVFSLFDELTCLQKIFLVPIALSRSNHCFQSLYPRNPFIQHLLQFQQLQSGYLIPWQLIAHSSVQFWTSGSQKRQCYSRHVTCRYPHKRSPWRSPQRHLLTFPLGSSFTSPIGAYYNKPIVCIFFIRYYTIALRPSPA